MNPQWQIGDKIENRWEIHEILKGGMGIVYVVYDHEWQEAFAAKTFQNEVFAEDSTAADRFKHEALAWIGLDIHQNVTQALIVKTFTDKPLLFLEYVSGGDLSSWIGTPRLTGDLPQVLRFAIQFCDGMIHALSKGVKAHRDIKPANCLITLDNTLKITDFGLAKVFDAIESKPSIQSSSRVEDFNIFASRTGMGAGTPPYMAPEQFEDVKHVDARADIYSFGVMLFQMLEGRLPFVARSTSDFERLHKSEPPPPLTEGKSPLAIVVDHCLAKDPAQRFSDFTVVRQQLAAIYETLMGQPASKPAAGKQLDAITLSNKGASLGNLGRNKEAVDCYDRAIALEPGFAGAYNNKGASLVRLGRNEEAIDCYDRAIALESGYAEAYTNKGISLCKLGRYEEALDCFDHAIALKPDDADAHVNKGASLVNLGRPEEAIDCFDLAITLKPNQAIVHYNKGASLSTLGRHEEALDCFDRVIALKRDYPEVHFNKGISLMNLGRLEEAIDYFDQAIALKPDDARAHYSKGCAWGALGRLQEAMIAFQKAHELGEEKAAAMIDRCRRELAFREN
jgi:tetratricopeptide (TPR) repeat protein